MGTGRLLILLAHCWAASAVLGAAAPEGPMLAVTARLAAATGGALEYADEVAWGDAGDGGGGGGGARTLLLLGGGGGGGRRARARCAADRRLRVRGLCPRCDALVPATPPPGLPPCSRPGVRALDGGRRFLACAPAPRRRRHPRHHRALRMLFRCPGDARFDAHAGRCLDAASTPAGRRNAPARHTDTLLPSGITNEKKRREPHRGFKHFDGINLHDASSAEPRNRGSRKANPDGTALQDPVLITSATSVSDYNRRAHDSKHGSRALKSELDSLSYKERNLQNDATIQPTDRQTHPVISGNTGLREDEDAPLSFVLPHFQAAAGKQNTNEAENHHHHKITDRRKLQNNEHGDTIHHHEGKGIAFSANREPEVSNFNAANDDPTKAANGETGGLLNIADYKTKPISAHSQTSNLLAYQQFPSRANNQQNIEHNILQQLSKEELSLLISLNEYMKRESQKHKSNPDTRNERSDYAVSEKGHPVTGVEGEYSYNQKHQEKANTGTNPHERYSEYTDQSDKATTTSRVPFDSVSNGGTLTPRTGGVIGREGGAMLPKRDLLSSPPAVGSSEPHHTVAQMTVSPDSQGFTFFPMETEKLLGQNMHPVNGYTMDRITTYLLNRAAVYPNRERYGTVDKLLSPDRPAASSMSEDPPSDSLLREESNSVDKVRAAFSMFDGVAETPLATEFSSASGTEGDSEAVQHVRSVQGENKHQQDSAADLFRHQPVEIVDKPRQFYPQIFTGGPENETEAPPVDGVNEKDNVAVGLNNSPDRVVWNWFLVPNIGTARNPQENVPNDNKTVLLKEGDILPPHGTTAHLSDTLVHITDKSRTPNEAVITDIVREVTPMVQVPLNELHGYPLDGATAGVSDRFHEIEKPSIPYPVTDHPDVITKIMPAAVTNDDGLPFGITREGLSDQLTDIVFKTMTSHAAGEGYMPREVMETPAVVEQLNGFAVDEETTASSSHFPGIFDKTISSNWAGHTDLPDDTLETLPATAMEPNGLQLDKITYSLNDELLRIIDKRNTPDQVITTDLTGDITETLPATVKELDGMPLDKGTAGFDNSFPEIIDKAITYPAVVRNVPGNIMNMPAEVKESDGLPLNKLNNKLHVVFDDTFNSGSATITGTQGQVMDILPAAKTELDGLPLDMTGIDLSMGDIMSTPVVKEPNSRPLLKASNIFHEIFDDTSNPDAGIFAGMQAQVKQIFPVAETELRSLPVDREAAVLSTGHVKNIPALAEELDRPSLDKTSDLFRIVFGDTSNLDSATVPGMQGKVMQIRPAVEMEPGDLPLDKKTTGLTAHLHGIVSNVVAPSTTVVMHSPGQLKESLPVVEEPTGLLDKSTTDLGGELNNLAYKPVIPNLAVVMHIADEVTATPVAEKELNDHPQNTITADLSNQFHGIFDVTTTPDSAITTPMGSEEIETLQAALTQLGGLPLDKTTRDLSSQLHGTINNIPTPVMTNEEMELPSAVEEPYVFPSFNSTDDMDGPQKYYQSMTSDPAAEELGTPNTTKEPLDTSGLSNQLHGSVDKTLTSNRTIDFPDGGIEAPLAEKNPEPSTYIKTDDLMNQLHGIHSEIVTPDASVVRYTPDELVEFPDPVTEMDDLQLNKTPSESDQLHGRAHKTVISDPIKVISVPGKVLEDPAAGVVMGDLTEAKATENDRVYGTVEKTMTPYLLENSGILGEAMEIQRTAAGSQDGHPLSNIQYHLFHQVHGASEARNTPDLATTTGLPEEISQHMPTDAAENESGEILDTAATGLSCPFGRIACNSLKETDELAPERNPDNSYDRHYNTLQETVFYDTGTDKGMPDVVSQGQVPDRAKETDGCPLDSMLLHLNDQHYGITHETTSSHPSVVSHILGTPPPHALEERDDLVSDTTSGSLGKDIDNVPDEASEPASAAVTVVSGREKSVQSADSVEDNGGLVFYSPTAHLDDPPHITSERTISQYSRAVTAMPGEVYNQAPGPLEDNNHFASDIAASDWSYPDSGIDYKTIPPDVEASTLTPEERNQQVVVAHVDELPLETTNDDLKDAIDGIIFETAGSELKEERGLQVKEAEGELGSALNGENGFPVNTAITGWDNPIDGIHEETLGEMSEEERDVPPVDTLEDILRLPLDEISDTFLSWVKEKDRNALNDDAIEASDNLDSGNDSRTFEPPTDPIPHVLEDEWLRSETLFGNDAENSVSAVTRHSVGSPKDTGMEAYLPEGIQKSLDILPEIQSHEMRINDLSDSPPNKDNSVNNLEETDNLDSDTYKSYADLHSSASLFTGETQKAESALTENIPLFYVLEDIYGENEVKQDHVGNLWESLGAVKRFLDTYLGENDRKSFSLNTSERKDHGRARYEGNILDTLRSAINVLMKKITDKSESLNGNSSDSHVRNEHRRRHALRRETKDLSGRQEETREEEEEEEEEDDDEDGVAALNSLPSTEILIPSIPFSKGRKSAPSLYLAVMLPTEEEQEDELLPGHVEALLPCPGPDCDEVSHEAGGRRASPEPLLPHTAPSLENLLPRGEGKNVYSPTPLHTGEVRDAVAMYLDDSGTVSLSHSVADPETENIYSDQFTERLISPLIPLTDQLTIGRSKGQPILRMEPFIPLAATGTDPLRPRYSQSPLLPSVEEGLLVNSAPRDEGSGLSDVERSRAVTYLPRFAPSVDGGWPSERDDYAYTYLPSRYPESGRERLGRRHGNPGPASYAHGVARPGTDISRAETHQDTLGQPHGQRPKIFPKDAVMLKPFIPVLHLPGREYDGDYPLFFQSSSAEQEIISQNKRNLEGLVVSPIGDDMQMNVFHDRKSTRRSQNQHLDRGAERLFHGSGGCVGASLGPVTGKQGGERAENYRRHKTMAASDLEGLWSRDADIERPHAPHHFSRRHQCSDGLSAGYENCEVNKEYEDYRDYRDDGNSGDGRDGAPRIYYYRGPPVVISPLLVPAGPLPKLPLHRPYHLSQTFGPPVDVLDKR